MNRTNTVLSLAVFAASPTLLHESFMTDLSPGEELLGVLCTSAAQLLRVSPDALLPALRELDGSLLGPPAWPVTATLQVASSSGRSTAQLTVLLLDGYPTVPAHCTVASTQRRAWETATAAALQALADAAAPSHCLHRLCAELQERLEAAEGEQQAERSARAVSEEPHQTLLLRIDHMNDRARYSRTICSWAAELGLSGRLLFLEGALILLLIEGPASATREYLLRARTRPVDVDFKGHPCREHMLRVERTLLRPPAFAGSFQQAQLTGVGQLRELLAQAGVADWVDEYLPAK
jgi:hypothetical protein